MTFGGIPIRKLTKKFHLNERDTTRGFQDYLLDNPIISDTLLPLMHYNKENLKKQETNKNGRRTEWHLPKTDERIVWPMDEHH